MVAEASGSLPFSSNNMDLRSKPFVDESRDNPGVAQGSQTPSSLGDVGDAGNSPPSLGHLGEFLDEGAAEPVFPAPLQAGASAPAIGPSLFEQHPTSRHSR